MVQLVNPKIKVSIFGLDNFVIEDLYMDYSVIKTIYEDPNEAEINIYNLNEDTRGKISDNSIQYKGVELHLTAAGSDEYVLAFRGELDHAQHYRMRPGHQTTLHCTSQKRNHRTQYVDAKTFAAGTPIDQIVGFFVDTIGLPSEVGELPSAGITLAESFSGPAFPLLKEYVFDLGMYTFITDGVLKISDIYAYQTPDVIEIPPGTLLAEPIATVVHDESEVERRAHVETTAKKKRRGRQTKREKQYGSNDYVEFEAIEEELVGMDFEFVSQPDIQPDDIISVDHPLSKGKYWRVREVEHFGDSETFDQRNTIARSVLYDQTGGFV